MLKENGPISWGSGQAFPTQNEWSWTNLSSVLYIEQPVGTGFSPGTPDVKNENDVAAQLVGFLQQFLEIFSELKGKNFYLTGESYAGMYVPYIANFIYENTTRSTLDLNLQGIWINDRESRLGVTHHRSMQLSLACGFPRSKFPPSTLFTNTNMCPPSTEPSSRN
jgi:carboxypeptidase D